MLTRTETIERAGFSNTNKLANAAIEELKKRRLRMPASEKSFVTILRRWSGGGPQFIGDRWAPMRQVLADVLKSTTARLFPSEVEPGHAFADFPKLGFLDPERDEVCRGDVLVEWHPGTRSRDPERPSDWLPGNRTPRRFDWFDRRFPSRRAWVTAEPGAGRSLALEWHRARSAPSLEIVATRRLVDVRVSPDADVPLMIRVDERGTGAVREVLAKIDAHQFVVVLAPFAHPAWDDRRTPIDSVSPPDPRESRWTDLRWAPSPDWRMAFVRWVGHRIEMRDPKRAGPVEPFLAWLETSDAPMTWLRTPAAILQAMRIWHEAGAAALRDGSTMIDEWLQAVVNRHVREGSGDDWYELSAARTARALIERQWSEAMVPWRAVLTPDEWAALVPSSVVGAVSAPARRKLLRRVASQRRVEPEDARQINTMLNELDSPATVIETLRRGGLLEIDDNEGLALRPEALRRPIAAARLRSMFDGESCAWGRLAVDPDRRSLVDAEIHALDLGPFRALVARHVSAREKGGLGHIGATEALFEEAGVRMALVQRSCLDGTASLSLLAMQQGLLWRKNGEEFHRPVTRPAAGESRDGGARWVVACQAWSIFGPKPSPVPDDMHPWQWPGWISPSWATLPMVLNNHRGHEGDSAREIAGVTLLTELAPRVVGGVRDTPAAIPPEKRRWALAPFLAAAALPVGLERNWDVSSFLVPIDQGPAQALVVATERVRALDASAVSRFWQLLMIEQDPALPERMRSALLRASIDAIHAAPMPETIEGFLRSHQWQPETLLSFLEFVPESDRLAAFDAAVGAGSVDAASLVEALRRSPQGAELLEHFASQNAGTTLDAKKSHGWGPRELAARALWDVAPERARERASEAYRQSGEWRRWLETATDADALIEIVATAGRPVPDGLQEDLRAWVARAGVHADRLYAVLGKGSG